MRRRLLRAALALTLVGGAVAWALAGLPGTPAACPAAGCDCEAPRPGPIRQPANAWSSLALAAAGMALLLASPNAVPPRGAPRPGRRSQRLDLLPPGALVLAGTAAFLFHAGLTAWAARLDGIAVAVLVAALAADLLPRGRGKGAPPGSIFRRGDEPARRGGDTRALRSPGRLAAALLPWCLLALGALCWALGRSGGPWCRPDSLLPAHAAWHLLAAGALLLWLWTRRARAEDASPNSPLPLPSRREDEAADEPAP